LSTTLKFVFVTDKKGGRDGDGERDEIHRELVMARKKWRWGGRWRWVGDGEMRRRR
jgi:hypothetical protein